jgi:GTP:adenosylcobinamide-phosphate guanylyltransferase
MAKAYGVTHKCALPVAGVPMLARVVRALQDSGIVASIAVSVETEDVLSAALGNAAKEVRLTQSTHSAPASVLAAASQIVRFPLLVTTGDHALLTPEMVRHFCNEATVSGADFCAGLARDETILAAYPQSVRTFFKLGKDRVSGCNLFALNNERALVVVQRWQYLDSLRKKPWRLVAAFGPVAILRFALGWIDLQSAFAIVSRRLGVNAKPVLMPFAEAAIDVDKPSDLELAEQILRARQN